MRKFSKMGIIVMLIFICYGFSYSSCSMTSAKVLVQSDTQISVKAYKSQAAAMSKKKKIILRCYVKANGSNGAYKHVKKINTLVKHLQKKNGEEPIGLVLNGGFDQESKVRDGVYCIKAVLNGKSKICRAEYQQKKKEYHWLKDLKRVTKGKGKREQVFLTLMYILQQNVTSLEHSSKQIWHSGLGSCPSLFRDYLEHLGFKQSGWCSPNSTMEYQWEYLYVVINRRMYFIDREDVSFMVQSGRGDEEFQVGKAIRGRNLRTLLKDPEFVTEVWSELNDIDEWYNVYKGGILKPDVPLTYYGFGEDEELMQEQELEYDVDARQHAYYNNKLPLLLPRQTSVKAYWNQLTKKEQKSYLAFIRKENRLYKPCFTKGRLNCSNYAQWLVYPAALNDDGTKKDVKYLKKIKKKWWFDSCFFGNHCSCPKTIW